VRPDLRVHDVEGLYVMDASVFPTNLGVNPQHSIMALAWRAAERLANTERLAAVA
jgi:choline dehydrogenase-like flavoprotein